MSGRPAALVAVLAAQTRAAAHPDRDYARAAEELLRRLRGFLADPDTPPFSPAHLQAFCRSVIGASVRTERLMARGLLDALGVVPAEPDAAAGALALAGAFLWWGAKEPEQGWPEKLVRGALQGLLAPNP